MSAAKIRELNDAFRSTMTGGRVMMTAGVDALPSDVKAMVIRRVATFSDFTPTMIRTASTISAPSSSPVGSSSSSWIISIPTMKFGSEDPADPAKTTRVLTIMLAEEY